MADLSHIDRYHRELAELIEFVGTDNEENIRPAFQNCLAAYCADHPEWLVLVPELRSDHSNKPDGTVRDSLRMTRGLWEAKDAHDDHRQRAWRTIQNRRGISPILGRVTKEEVARGAHCRLLVRQWPAHAETEYA